MSLAAAARRRVARHSGLTPVYVRSLYLPGQGLSAASGRIVARQVLAASRPLARALHGRPGRDHRYPSAAVTAGTPSRW